MNHLDAKWVECPYCGEAIEILIDCSIPAQKYIEDCQVCCRPIHFDVSIQNEAGMDIICRTEDEA